MTNVFGSKRAGGMNSGNAVLIIWTVLMTAFFLFQGGKMVLSSLEKRNEANQLLAEIDAQYKKEVENFKSLDAYEEGFKAGRAEGAELVSTDIVNTLVQCKPIAPTLDNGNPIQTPDGVALVGIGAHCRGVSINEEELTAHQEEIGAQIAEARAAGEEAQAAEVVEVEEVKGDE